VQGDPTIIELLNEVLTAELTAINQYFVDSKMHANWGYERLAKRFYDESIEEMKDAERLIERILYLEGVPNLQRLGQVRVGETVEEKLRLALSLEREAIERLNGGIQQCVDAGDNGSRKLLDGVIEGEEAHADWLDTQLALIAQVGEPQYLAQQIHDE
jgi:bacterioferritin